MAAARCRIVAVVALFACLGVVGCARNDREAARLHLERGRGLLESGNAAGAIVELRNAVRRDQRMGEAHYALGQAYLAAGQPANALRAFVRAADLMPDSAEVQLQAGSVLLLAGQFDDARARAERVIAADPRHVGALFLRARALAGQADLEGAVRQLEEAVKLDPGDPWTVSTLGGLQLRQGRREEAEAAFQKALELSPDSADVRVSLALNYLQVGEVARAVSLLGEAVALEPGHRLANRALAAAHLSAGRLAEAEPILQELIRQGEERARLTLADVYTASGRLDRAATLLEEARASKGIATEVLCRLALIRETQQTPEEATRLVAEAQKGNPKHPLPLITRARLEIGRRNVDAAVTSARTATQTDPSSVEAFFWLGRAEAAAGRPDEALKAFREAVRLDPRAGPVHLDLAGLLLARGEPQAALTHAQAALQAQPLSIDAQIALVKAYAALGQQTQAEQALQPLLSRAASNAAVHVQHGTLRAFRGDRGTARRAFVRALELDPASFEALTGLVSLDVAEGRLDQGLERVRAQQSRRPDDSRLLLLEASLHQARRDVEAAERALRKAIDLDPRSFAAYEMLGRLYFAAGRMEQAIGEFRQVVSRQPSHLGAATMIGLGLEALGRKDEARQHYEALVRDNPRAAVAANNLAWMYAEGGGNLDVALQLAQSAKAQLPESPEIDDTLGFIYLKKNLPQLALAPLRAAVARLPDNPYCRYHLGQALMATGDKAGARREFEAALAADGTFTQAAEVRRALDALARSQDVAPPR
jgi:putative PEP-CTERM system TPR-repeat lipoprotein